jgi:hypothetical protein
MTDPTPLPFGDETIDDVLSRHAREGDTLSQYSQTSLIPSAAHRAFQRALPLMEARHAQELDAALAREALRKHPLTDEVLAERSSTHISAPPARPDPRRSPIPWRGVLPAHPNHKETPNDQTRNPQPHR